MDESDLIAAARGTMWWQNHDGSISEVFENDPPLLVGEIRPASIRAYVSTHSSWYNQELFDMLDRAWKRPGAHKKK